ncbi:unnamed protein product [Eretmochelys imbricata]
MQVVRCSGISKRQGSSHQTSTNVWRLGRISKHCTAYGDSWGGGKKGHMTLPKTLGRGARLAAGEMKGQGQSWKGRGRARASPLPATLPGVGQPIESSRCVPPTGSVPGRQRGRRLPLGESSRCVPPTGSVPGRQRGRRLPLGESSRCVPPTGSVPGRQRGRRLPLGEQPLCAPHGQCPRQAAWPEAAPGREQPLCAAHGQCPRQAAWPEAAPGRAAAVCPPRAVSPAGSVAGGCPWESALVAPHMPGGLEQSPPPCQVTWDRRRWGECRAPGLGVRRGQVTWGDHVGSRDESLVGVIWGGYVPPFSWCPLCVPPTSHLSEFTA